MLEKFLRKLGLSSYSELSDEERKTYRSWEESLSGRKITDDDVKVFLETEKEATINKLTTAAFKTRDDIFLKMKLELLRKIETFLLSPVLEKQSTEAHIKQVLES